MLSCNNFAEMEVGSSDYAVITEMETNYSSDRKNNKGSTMKVAEMSNTAILPLGIGDEGSANLKFLKNPISPMMLKQKVSCPTAVPRAPVLTSTTQILSSIYKTELKNFSSNLSDDLMTTRIKSDFTKTLKKFDLSAKMRKSSLTNTLRKSILMPILKNSD